MPKMKTTMSNKYPAGLTEEVIELALKYQQEFKVPACVTIAQYGLESAWGGKHLGSANNYFGIKAIAGHPSVEVTTDEYVGGREIVQKANFAVFDTMDACFAYHSQLLANPHGPYGGALYCINDWRKWLQKIAPVYATDPKYFDKLCEIIEDFKLDQIGPAVPS